MKWDDHLINQIAATDRFDRSHVISKMDKR
jgi:hypothetical protein